MSTITEPAAPVLTDRELSIVRLVAMGRRNADIAEGLGISVRTVDAHLQRIYRKTRTHNRVQLSSWLWGTE